MDMQTYLQVIVAVVCSVMASSGFWAWCMKRNEQNDVRTRMLIGLGHDRIVYLGLSYIRRGSITRDEHENLTRYLYEPYTQMGGNGTAKRIIEEVNKLPIRALDIQAMKNTECNTFPCCYAEKT